MKQMPLVLLLFALPGVAAAQATGGPEADQPLTSYKTFTTGQHLTSMPLRPGFAVTSQRKVGGFIVDCATSKPASKMLDLRQPEDLKRDLRNVSFDPVTGKAAGFKLFAFNF